MNRTQINPFWMWVLALTITLAGLVWQRISAPSYPINVEETWRGSVVKGQLQRSHFKAENQRVVINGVQDDWQGELLWRSFTQPGPFRREVMRNLGSMMVGEIPLQTRGSRVEYRIELHVGDDVLRLPSYGTVVTRFKGSIPIWMTLGHVLLVYLGLLFATRAGLEAFVLGPHAPRFALFTLLAFLLGGLVCGPFMKLAAYGQPWSSIPLDVDRTDTKTLLLVCAWCLPVIARWFGRRARAWILLASCLTLLAFSIPHTVLGAR